MKSIQLSRRTVLRGVGTAMALPWLEAMAPRKAHAQTAPLRWAMLYSPNGFLMDLWTPAMTGANYPTPPLHTPLEAHKADYNVLSGLGNYTASIAPEFGGSHTRATGSFLTQMPLGGTLKMAIKNGISLDQILAKEIGTKTKFPSLQIGGRASSTTGACEDNYACAYNNNLSWSGPTTYLPKQVNPRDVFNRLFGSGAPMPMPGTPAPIDNSAFYGKSILDVVAMRADMLKGKLGKTDKAKLDEYFTSVREVEMRLDRIAGNTVPGAQPAMCTIGTPPKDSAAGEIPFPEHLNLLSDMLALAFQCDVTRIATYMFEHSFSDARSFSFLPGVTGRHHSITHSVPQKAQEEKISRFYVERFAYFLGKLKSMKEGDKTVLDNSIIYFASEFGSGAIHDHRKVAVIVAGKAGGKWKTGSHIDYPPAPGAGTGVDGRGNPADTQLAHLHLATLHAFGINQATYGQDENGKPMASKPLTEFVA